MSIQEISSCSRGDEIKAIALHELEQGCAKFREYESRDAMYRVACRLVQDGWNRPAEVADGLGVVLLTWNNAAYRYGTFSFDKLEEFLERNQEILGQFRVRHIEQFTVSSDAGSVKTLFEEALEALAYTHMRRKTPVGAAKALHILAPSFFPLWDRKIANGTGCDWATPRRPARQYVRYMEWAQTAIASLEAQFGTGDRGSSLPPAADLRVSLSTQAGCSKTMLKFLDEYLYAKYTKGWI